MTRPLLALALLLAAAALPAAEKGPEPLVVARGERIELTDYLVPGKIVIFDFTSKYCPPCRMYEEPLKGLHQKRADIAVVKVDINRPETKGIDWKSPVAQQFGLRSIPHFKVFDKDGKLMAEGDEAYEMVNRWLQ